MVFRFLWEQQWENDHKWVCFLGGACRLKTFDHWVRCRLLKKFQSIFPSCEMTTCSTCTI